MKILDKKQIKHKTKRLAIEILENNFEEQEIALAGINNNGMTFARLIAKEIKRLQDIRIVLTRIRLNPAAPLSNQVKLEMPVEELKGKVIIIVDDVSNTGRTMFYAFKPLLDILPKKIEVAVLVDRKHKSYPIHPDYVGLALATTLQENIEVRIQDTSAWAVYLT